MAYQHYTVRRSLGHVLACLERLQITNRIVEAVTVDTTTCEVRYQGKLFAHYRYFDGIEDCLFRFEDPVYSQQNFVRLPDGKLQARFHLSLSNHGTPGLVVEGHCATPEVHAFLMRTLTHWMNDPWYDLHKKAGAFFQGGSHDPKGKWFYIEFWIPAGAEAYLKALNEQLMISDPALSQE